MHSGDVNMHRCEQWLLKCFEHEIHEHYSFRGSAYFTALRGVHSNIFGEYFVYTNANNSQH